MTKKIYSGEVISNTMNKTVVVAVKRLFQHPKYKKTVKRVTKFKAHDEDNRCRVGDMVKILEVRPLSKEKRWIVLDVLNRAARGE
ncbi:MAG TPA: 30S ribosomal protein S17 [Thermodesulfovibrionales bacterium]|nr:30S ribosomal protein S17 [Thermodesulfovibrionales bacterium]